jgi:hypothetical protein
MAKTKSSKKQVISKSKTRKIRKATKIKLSPPKDYIVAIPTYKRYQQVYDKSISTLIKGKVPASKIHIFVANKAEEKAYKEALPSDSYHKIIIGKIGITNQRKFMVKYFKEGTNVLFLDDDVERVEKLNKTSTKYNPIPNLDTFIKKAFTECHKRGIYLWGIYPVRNPLFMKARPEMATGLRFILGTFYGQVIRHNKALVPSVQEKEDFELSILHYIKDGSVLRFDKVTIKTKFYNPKGGIAARETDRLKVNKIAAETLKKKYPEYGSIWQRKDGRYEFKLKPLRA